MRPRHSADALHVAQATVASCRVIVSWNFKHIVHFAKIPLYNAVNVWNAGTSMRLEYWLAGQLA